MAPHSVLEYDVIVVGAGAVGENVADRTVQGGLSTVIVESELVGGECSYWACMPSKALLRSGAARDAALRVAGSRESVTSALDIGQVLERRNSFTSNWSDDGQVDWLRGAGIELVRGTARLAGEREVTVTAADGTETLLRARHAVALCTGSAAAIPDIPGLRESNPWTSREATSASEVPPSLVIIGGGVVGAEMATAYASLGSRVTVLSRGPLLSSAEPFAGERVAAALREAGATVLQGAHITSVERTGEGVRVHLDAAEDIVADRILVATGRRPRTERLGLDSVGLEDGSWLSTDDSLLVLDSSGSVLQGEWLYAVGDVNHRALLTHQGKYQARAAGDAIVARARNADVSDASWGAHVATADHCAVPQVTFTDPQVASVGLTAEQAQQRGFDIRVVDYEIGNVAGAALQADGYDGQARLVVDESRHVLLGATFVGQDVAELLHSATIAVVGEVPIERLWHAVPSYPTISEVWLRLLEAYGRPAR